MIKDKTIYKKNIPSTILNKLTKLKSNDMAFLTLNDTYYIGKSHNYDFSIEITDLDNNFVSLVIYWGDYRYYTIFRTIRL